MPKQIDLSNNKYNRWYVICRANTPTKRPHWLCRCDCGNLDIIEGYNLRSGRSKSCGCLQKEVVSKDTRDSDHPLYNMWTQMRNRCNNPKHKSFPSYGAKGIKVCERWNSFQNFIQDMGERPEGYTLDRKDPEQGYHPDNCRWVTLEVQLRNRAGYGSSKYKGVQKTTRNTYSVTFLNKQKQTEHLGTFADEIEAANIYDERAYSEFGFEYPLNFPENFKE